LLLCAGMIVYVAVAGQNESTALVQPPSGDDLDAVREISEAGLPIERVTIAGKEYRLELAASPTARYKGLSDREEIKVDGGMLFVFPRQQVGVQRFVMRNCLADIDIIYLDPKMRITAMHAMKVEPARRPDEPKTPDARRDRYFARLKKYSSKFPAQYAIELKGGTIEELRKDPDQAKMLRRGQVIELDAQRLVKAAR